MTTEAAAKSARPNLSLYANLLDPSSNKDSAAGTISRAPLVFKQPAEEDLRQEKAASEKQQLSAGRYEPTSGFSTVLGFDLAHCTLCCDT